MPLVDNIFLPMQISASALTAQQVRMDVIANNIANANTTRTEANTPYRRKRVIFAPKDAYPVLALPPFIRVPGHVGGGVHVIRIEEDPAPFKRIYQPNHPDADKDGYVLYPNVEVVMELVDLIDASRAYEANAITLSTSYDILLTTLRTLGGER